MMSVVACDPELPPLPHQRLMHQAAPRVIEQIEEHVPHRTPAWCPTDWQANITTSAARPTLLSDLGESAF
jgi:hypothetical protein